MFTGLVTTGEAARRLGISDRHIRKLLAEGRIKSTQIGGHWLIDEGDLTTIENPEAAIILRRNKQRGGKRR